MRVEILKQVNVCRCGCGAEIAEGNDFVASHDTKLQARLRVESGWTKLTGPEKRSMYEYQRIFGDFGPAVYGLGHDVPGLVATEEGVQAFLRDRVLERMAETEKDRGGSFTS